MEDPKNPLLGPTIKGLYLFGLWQTGSKIRIIIYNLIHFSSLLFFIRQYVDLYFVRYDINKVLNNMSLTVLGAIFYFAKCYSYVMWQGEWRKLISDEEEKQIERKNQIIMFCVMVFITHFHSFLCIQSICINFYSG